MSIQWFVLVRDEEIGPFSSSQLKNLAQQGRIKSGTSIRRGDSDQWVSASRIKGLLDSPQPTASPVSETPVTEDALPKIHVTGKIEANEISNINPIGHFKIPVYLWVGVGSVSLLLISLICVFILPSEESGTTAGITEKVVAKSESSVAFIKGRLSTGTGFLIQKNILATNRHVIEGELMRHVKVHFPSATEDTRGPYTAQLLYIDDEIDLALLSVDSPLSPLRCADSYEFRRGQDILVIGNPGIAKNVVLQNAVSRGVMSTQTVIDGQQYNQLGVSINSGNSGGPVLDHSGTVIGVVTLKDSKQEGLGFSIPIQAVNMSLNNANSMTDIEVAREQSFHRARVVFKYVNASSYLYKHGMIAYTEAMSESIDSGRSANDGLTKVRSKIEEKITSYDEALIGDLKKELSSISTDNNIPDSTRQRIVDFWTNYLELKSYVEKPRGNYNSYSKKCAELSDKYDRLSESVNLLLGNSY